MVVNRKIVSDTLFVHFNGVMLDSSSNSLYNALGCVCTTTSRYVMYQNFSSVLEKNIAIGIMSRPIAMFLIHTLVNNNVYLDNMVFEEPYAFNHYTYIPSSKYMSLKIDDVVGYLNYRTNTNVFVCNDILNLMRNYILNTKQLSNLDYFNYKKSINFYTEDNKMCMSDYNSNVDKTLHPGFLWQGLPFNVDATLEEQIMFKCANKILHINKLALFINMELFQTELIQYKLVKLANVKK